MEPYRPTSRVLAVLELLQSRRRITGAEIAERLEVSRRSARRYVEILRELGVPVEGERGRYGAYSLRPGFKLPPMMFTEDEALGLGLSLLAARGLGLSGVAPAVEGALAKVERVMPEFLGERIRALEETVIPAVARPAELAGGEVIVALAEAVRWRRRVRLRYRSGLGEETERWVDPYAVVNREGYWYAVGQDHLRERMRLFRLDRVLEAEVLEETFVRPPGFDDPQQVLDALAAMPQDRWSVEVLLEATLEEAREQTPPMGVALEEAGDRVILRSSTSDLGWIARVLASLSFSFVVLRPPELREALRRHAAEVAALAERTVH
jgi:predicted DNA-binding transcriptional regulator YafY